MDEPPTKRRRLSTVVEVTPEVSAEVRSQLPESSAENRREYDVGIRAFVNTDFTPFVGTFKARYSDFLVNEILPSGKVVHLRNTHAPKHPVPGHLKQIKDPNFEPLKPREVTKSDECSAEPPVKAEEPEKPLPDVSGDDRAKLVSYFNEDAVQELIDLYQSIRNKSFKKVKDLPAVRTNFTTDRSVRSRIHQSIREIFSSTIDSSTDRDGTLVLSAANVNERSNNQGNQRNRGGNKGRPQGKLGWAERGGEYVHFTLYKENKDTMEAISWVSRQLNSNPKNFQFAGTKDRRAVTTQRCCAFRIDAERLAAQNRSLRGSKIGDFEYRPNGLELGDLVGNEFVITLRDCRLSTHDDTVQKLETVEQSMWERMRSLRQNGYLNYYGGQRFGTFSIRTDMVGAHCLREDYQAACDAILSYEKDALEAAKQQDSTTTIGQDDRARALAINKWREEGTLNAALDILPRKFSGEAQLMRHLTRHSTDFIGALLTIQRNLRLMYVHAYQSLVWNLAATNRMQLYGNKVVKGDLVLVNEHKDKEKQTDGAAAGDTMIDADGEQIIEPGANDRAAIEDDVFERARALTEEEAQSGQYSIFDVVLPQPGYDILCPDNESGKFYETFMSSPEGGRLDPHNMRRKHRDFSLSGAYRKLLARIGEDFEVNAYKYAKDEEQFVKTDLQVLEAETASKQNGHNGGLESDVNASKEVKDKIAVVLKFQLGSSQYATMALRELSKGGIAQHKPEFKGGR